LSITQIAPLFVRGPLFSPSLVYQKRDSLEIDVVAFFPFLTGKEYAGVVLLSQMDLSLLSPSPLFVFFFGGEGEAKKGCFFPRGTQTSLLTD